MCRKKYTTRSTDWYAHMIAIENDEQEGAPGNRHTGTSQDPMVGGCIKDILIFVIKQRNKGISFPFFKSSGREGFGLL